MIPRLLGSRSSTGGVRYEDSLLSCLGYSCFPSGVEHYVSGNKRYHQHPLVLELLQLNLDGPQYVIVELPSDRSHHYLCCLTRPPLSRFLGKQNQPPPGVFLAMRGGGSGIGAAASLEIPSSFSGSLGHSIGVKIPNATPFVVPCRLETSRIKSKENAFPRRTPGYPTPPNTPLAAPFFNSTSSFVNTFSQPISHARNSFTRQPWS